MGDDLLDSCEEATATSELNSYINESLDFPQTLVTEKIIFCVDIMLLSKEDNSITIIYNLLKSYFTLKRKICVKPPEFECLLINSNDGVVHFNINSAKDLHSALKFVENIAYDEELKPLELDKIFTHIASLVELPDPETYKECLPSNWVYHVVWLFGRNLYVPTMENRNPFDFLMMSPYFALDILYLYDTTEKNNLTESISQILASLNENGKGYFLKVLSNDSAKIYASFAQFLGHPLIRSSQSKAIFSISDLGPVSDTIEESDSE